MDERYAELQRQIKQLRATLSEYQGAMFEAGLIVGEARRELEVVMRAASEVEPPWEDEEGDCLDENDEPS